MRAPHADVENGARAADTHIRLRRAPRRIVRRPLRVPALVPRPQRRPAHVAEHPPLPRIAALLPERLPAHRKHMPHGFVPASIGDRQRVAFKIQASSPDGTRALFTDGAKTILFDTRDGREIVRLASIELPRFARSSPNGDRWVVIGRSRSTVVSVTGASFDLAASFDASAWRDLPDGAPFAWSPDGEDAVILGVGGKLERRRGAELADVAWSVRVTEGEQCVEWPRSETMVTLGKRRIVARSARDGAVLAEHTW